MMRWRFRPTQKRRWHNLNTFLSFIKAKGRESWNQLRVNLVCTSIGTSSRRWKIPCTERYGADKSRTLHRIAKSHPFFDQAQFCQAYDRINSVGKGKLRFKKKYPWSVGTWLRLSYRWFQYRCHCNVPVVSILAQGLCFCLRSVWRRERRSRRTLHWRISISKSGLPGTTDIKQPASKTMD